MLRTFLKPQNLRRVISLSNYARGCATNSQPVDANAVKRRTNLVAQSGELNALAKPASVAKSTSSLDNLIKNVNDCKSLSSLFELIKPHLAELTDTHLNVIFTKLNDLFFDSSMFDRQRVLKSKQTLQNSPVFKSLMDRTNRLVNKLCTSTLLSLLHTFSLAALDPQFVVVKRTISELNSRLDVLEQNAVIECAKQLHYYLGICFTEQLFKFNGRVLQTLQRDLQINRIDPTNIKKTTNFWFIFLKPENDPRFEVAEYMAKRLLSPDVKLCFKQAVLLMRKIKLNHYLYRERLNKPEYQRMRGIYYKQVELEFNRRNLFPRILADLMDKCNSVICETLGSEEATEQDFGYFLSKLHDFTDDINHEFPNFYEPKILQFVVPYLIANIENNARLKAFIFELVQNYTKFNIFDDKLIKFTYDLFLSDEKLRINGSPIFFILSKYRLPFVDHRHLSKVLFNFSTQIRQSTKMNPLRVLSELILNDVEDENLFGYLNDIVDNLTDEYYQSFKSINQFKQISLARHHLSIKNWLKDGLKAKLQNVLDQAIYSLSIFNKKPKISYRLYFADQRFLSNGYLSNGVCLDTFAIYDSLRAELIPMTRSLVDSFKHRVDKIPRIEGQEMYVSREREPFEILEL